jgi:predicted GIY-YIG superfamily endonuclease
MFYVYILKCKDGSYYTGHTDDIDKRINEHVRGETPSYTSKRLPVTLVYMQEFPSRYEALVAERQIKSWGRNKKEALIKQNWELISLLSKRRVRSNPSRRFARQIPQDERPAE